MMMKGYPPAIIHKQDHLKYRGALETAQLGGSKEIYQKHIVNSAERSLETYLTAAKGKSAKEKLDSEPLLKIGDLAKKVSETVPTIHYWTKEGLIGVAEITASRYQLFSLEMSGRCQEIKLLKEKRYKINEIKKLLIS